MPRGCVAGDLCEEALDLLSQEAEVGREVRWSALSLRSSGFASPLTIASRCAKT